MLSLGGEMQADAFYDAITQCTALPPPERHTRMSEIHTHIVNVYTKAIRRITPEQAAQPVSTSDRRTLAQVVGHITAWERFAILAAGDILAGVHHPRMLTSVEGFIEPDGQTITFAGIDDFNHYQAQQQALWTWAHIQEQALETANIVHTLFTHPQLLSAERLEQTKPHRKRLHNGTLLEDVTMGWCLWLIVLEHEAVEHAGELGLSDS